MTTSAPEDVITDLAGKFVEYIETGIAPEGLFAPDVFLDISFPQWRLQAATRADALAIRAGGHPWPGHVARSRLDPTPTGFVFEWEERWHQGGQNWYCREMMRADVQAGRIQEFSVYCTGDWSEEQVAQHRADVTLIRP